MEETVILVDENDREIGTGEKMQVHHEGKLHRSFSIFVFNSKRELLMQKRNKNKYHSGGLWSNTACGHPRPGEDIVAAGERRLQEEMGIRTKLKEMFTFTYKGSLDHGLIEHEYDHVLTGVHNDSPLPNIQEVEDWKFASLESIGKGIRGNPDAYTAWFPICFDEVRKRR